MQKSVSLDLLQNVLNTQKSLITIFKDSKLFVANKAFLNFFHASSVDDFNNSFRNFTDCFVPHPSYFGRDNIVETEHWFESIVKRSEEDRTVSMLTPAYEPHAFSVTVGERIDNCSVVTFVDVTQTLIQRIMIENHANIDSDSGAYDRKYFLYVCKNYEDGALFSKKVIGVIKIVLEDEISQELLRDFVQNIKLHVREDDMLVRWDTEEFLFVCLVDKADKVNLIVSKLKSMSHIKANFSSVIQTKAETILELISTLND